VARFPKSEAKIAQLAQQLATGTFMISAMSSYDRSSTYRNSMQRRYIEFAALEWVAWFNTRRLLEPIRHIPPAEHEEAYYSRQQGPAELAALM